MEGRQLQSGTREEVETELVRRGGKTRRGKKGFNEVGTGQDSHKVEQSGGGGQREVKREKAKKIK